ncbi:MAG TPA: phage portal protein, partial [Amaricoccus sp.]|nr:phage portal protein [Amaricoccus sp.]
ERRRREHAACAWLPPKWDWVDPLKDARAEIEQIEAGLKSRTQALAERGFDVEQVDAEIAADRARERELGLSFASAAPIDPAAADAAAADDAPTPNGADPDATAN